MSYYFPNIDPVYIYKRKGDTSDPFLFLQETVNIRNNKVVLKEIPKFEDKVRVTKTSDGSPLTEVNSDTPGVNEYRVDYTVGVVFFNASLEGYEVTLEYTGTGYVSFPANRIWTEQNQNGLIETLQDSLDVVQQGVDTLNQVGNLVFKGKYDPLVSYKKWNFINYNNKTFVAIADVQGEDPSASSKWQLVSSGSSWLGVYDETKTYTVGDMVSDPEQENIYSSLVENNVGNPLTDTDKWSIIINTKELFQNVRQATADATVAKENANTKANYAQTQGDYAKSVGDNLKHKGDYNNTIAYKVGNMVWYQGLTHMCIKDTTPGISPADDVSYWRVVSNETTVNSQTWTATQGQTVFNITNGSYSVGAKHLKVWVGGVLQTNGDGFTETSPTSFTLSQPLDAGEKVYAEWFEGAVTFTKGHNQTHKKGGSDEIKPSDIGAVDKELELVPALTDTDGNTYTSLKDRLDNVAGKVTLNSKQWIAIEGQTEFTIDNGSYIPGANRIEVYVSGIRQRSGVHYTETNSTTITLSTGVSAGTEVEARWFEGAIGLNKPHASTHKAGGQDELNIKDLAGYQTEIADKIGILGNLNTSDKSNLVKAVNEVNSQLGDIASNVKKFGAKGDGVTDDTTIVQNTINNYPVIYLPPGTYNLTSLNIPTNKRVKGAGINKTILKFTGTTGNFITMADMVNSISRASLEDVTIDCNNAGDVGLFLRYLTNGTYFKNIELTNVGNVGIDLSQSWYAQFENVRVRKGGTGNGWNIHSDVGQVNSIDFIGCQAHSCGGVGFYVNATHGCSFISCQSENNNLEGLQIEGGGGGVYQDFYLENNSKTMAVPYNVSIGKNTQVIGAMFIGGFVTGRGGTNSANVFIDKAYDVSILGMKFEVMDAANRPTNHVQATVNSQGVSILPVIISGAGTANFTTNITVFSQRNNPPQFANGVKTNTIYDNGDGKVSFDNTSIAVKDGKNVVSYGANNSAFGYLTYNSTNGEYQIQTYNGTSYNATPVRIFPKILNDALKTKKSSHTANYAPLYVDLSTGEIYSF